jgi:hypothetical protein
MTGDADDENPDACIRQLVLKIQTTDARKARVWNKATWFVCRLLRRNSCDVPKVSEGKPTDLNMPCIAAHAKSSSSTTNTVRAAAGVIHGDRLLWVG